MVCSFASVIQAVADYLPPQLVSPQALHTTTTLLTQFPDAISHHFGFECRLGHHTSAVDFALLVTQASDGHKILADQHATIHLPSSLFLQPGWAQIRDFCSHWTNPASALHHHVQGIWLEFDGTSQNVSTPLPAPGFFFNTGAVEEASPPPPLRDDDDTTWITHTALPLLDSSTISAKLDQILTMIAASSLARIQLHQIGLFPSRHLNAVRLVLGFTSQENLLASLDNLGWIGPLHEIQELVTPLYPLADYLYLNIDVGAEVYPQIGVECHFDEHKQPGNEKRWSSLLAHLVETGLCTPEKQNALLNFPGYSTDNFLYERIFFRGLHHIKVVYRPGQPLEAKAYIGYRHRPVNWLDIYLKNQPATELA